MIALLIVASVAFLLYSIVRYYQYVAKYPKGPTPLPFIGNVLDFDFSAQDKTFNTLGKEHKAVIYTVFTPNPYVQITEYDIIREAFIDKGEFFTNRPANSPVLDAFAIAPNTGVINSSDGAWRENRRAALSILRDFGMGKNLLEEQVRSSIAEYIEYLSGISDKDNVDMHFPIQIMVGNIINEVLFGFRYKHDQATPLMNYVNDFRELLGTVADSKALLIGAAFPVLTKLPIIRRYTVGRLKSISDKINKFIIDNAERSLKGYSVDDEPTCFPQAYKQRIGQNEYIESVNLHEKYERDIQEKLRQEVWAVVGKERLPMMSDQPKMIYARACVLELQRRANIFQTNIFRVTVADVEIRGQTIPKGTWVNADIHYLMANDPLFENPEEFRPERYIAEDGKSLRKELAERTIPFSIGKRACAGEGLARVELFLGLTATFQHFRISASPGQTIDLEPVIGTFMLPKPHKLRLERL